MKQKRSTAILAGVSFAIVMGTFDGLLPAHLAQTGAALASSPAGSAFTYQGQLKHNGQAVTGPVNLVFRLYNAAAGGNNLGELFLPNTPVGDGGLVTVQLDFGQSPFTGEARWLEIVVNNSVLTPRQAIRPAPYALRALNGGDSVWSTNGNNAHYNAGDVGIGTAEPSARLSIVQPSATAPGATVAVQSSDSQHAGVLSVNFAKGPGVVGTGFHNDGVRGFTEGDTFAGIYGQASNLLGYGVFGLNSSVGNHGFLGQKDAGVTGVGFSSDGVRGYTNGETFSGVYGHSSHLLGYGVFGRNAPNGNFGYLGQQDAGVGGVAWGTSGVNYGVYGETKSGEGYGGYFVGGLRAVSGRSTGIGVYGLKMGGGSFPGVWGETESQSSQANGVRGIVISTNPGALSSGVRGINNGTGSAGVGVWGSHAGSGWGVYGSAANNGRGVVGEATGGGQGVVGMSQSGTGVLGEVSNANGYAGMFLGGRSYFSGNVGIGAIVPTFQLQLTQNSAAKPTSNTWTISSDARLKRNIHTIENALDDLLSLRGVTYQWIDPDNQGGMTGTYTGLIAQEVEHIFPEWIRDDEDGFKTLTVIGFEGLVIEALRELREENRELRKEHAAELAALRAEHEDIKAQLQQLMNHLLNDKTGASR